MVGCDRLFCDSYQNFLAVPTLKFRPILVACYVLLDSVGDVKFCI